MTMWKSILILGLLLACSACSTIPFRATELVRTRPATAAELLGGLWTSGPALFLVRQSALFEFQGMRMPLAGVMKLDAGKKSARLVGMNDMGVKLFDLSVDRGGQTAHFVMPELARYPQFAEAVSGSVRRMFLDPEPSGEDLLAIGADSYRLTRERRGHRVDFIFGGADRQLLEKSCTGPDEHWQVRYFEYRQQGAVPFPWGIILEDKRAGYRLTLWLESVEQTDD